MNAAELTPEQQTIVENVITEFKKLNNPITPKGGLINLGNILTEDARRTKEIQRIKINNDAIDNLVLERIKSDCERLNVDLCTLGLEAYKVNNWTVYINCLRRRADTSSTIRIQYETLKRWHGDIRESEYLSVHLLVRTDDNGMVDVKFDSIEELTPNIEKRILKLYEKYGKENL